MRSLKSILNAKTINLVSLHSLIDSIPQYFSNTKKLPRNAVNLVLVEMIPDENLENISQKVNAELKVQCSSAVLDAKVGALALLAAAVQYKLDIKNKKNESLNEQIIKLEKQNATNNSKDISQKIKELRDISDVAKKFEGSTIDARTSRFHLNIRMLNDIFTQAPSYINNFTRTNNESLASSLRILNGNYNKLIDAQAAFAPENELLDLYKQCEAESDVLISGICAAIGLRIEEQRAKISASAHNQMSASYAGVMSQFSALVNAENQETIYHEISEKLKKLVTSLQNLIHELPDSPTESEYRKKEIQAKQRIKIEFPADEYKYFLGPRDLRSSKNTFIKSQIDFSKIYFGEIEDQDKFILAGKPSNKETKNLFQLRKDALREVNIQHKSYVANKLLTMNNLNALLITEFGENNAEHIRTHFDQSLSLMVGVGPTNGVTTIEEQLAEFPLALKSPEPKKESQSEETKAEQPTDETQEEAEDVVNLEALERARKNQKKPENPPVNDQDLYKDGDIVYRSMKVSHYLLLVPDEPEQPWIFKVNVKALAWVSKDGFVVECIATDSPLICNALLKNSEDQSPENSPTPKQQLQGLVNIVREAERDTIVELERLKRKDKPSKKAAPIDPNSIEMNLTQKQGALESALRQIKDFKEGRISFDDVVANYAAITLQIKRNIPHQGTMSTFLQTYTPFEKTSTTAKQIEGISDKLTAFKKQLDASVNTYKRENLNMQEAALEEKVEARVKSPSPQR